MFMLLDLASAIFLWNQSLQGGCPFKVSWPYMGLVTQGLLVGIYFAVSRYYDGSRSIWWIAGITAGIVTFIGLLNRLDIDVLGTFRGMENGEWNGPGYLSPSVTTTGMCGIYQCDGRYLSGSCLYGKTTGQSVGDAWKLSFFGIGYYLQ